jgi:hypothetical protein
MAQRNRQQRNRSENEGDRNRIQRGREQYGRDDRDRYYADDVGLQNLSHIDEPWWRENEQQLRERNQQSQGNYERGQQDYRRGQEDYGRDYGRTQHFDESIAGRPSGFEGGYGYRAGSPSMFGTGGRFSNFGVGRNTSIGQSGYGSSESGRGFGRSHFGSGESWRSQFDNSGTGENWRDRSQHGSSGSGESWRSEFNEGQNYTGRGPKGYRRSDDRIREEVCEVLTFEPSVDASEIEVIVMDGNVTLSGNVDDRNQKRRAEEVVENVSGVRDVHNNVKVSSGIFGSEQHPEKQLPAQTGKESKRAA